MRLLVIGRGLLGSSLLRQAPGACGLQYAVNWSEPAQATTDIVRGLDHFFTGVDGRWGIAWCAGSGVVGSAAADLVGERLVLEAALARIQMHAHRGPGALFIASSAGGVYGAGSTQHVTESARVTPRTPYGESKLIQEEMVRTWTETTGVPSLAGRISNLYGPGQNLAKPQGFISHLMRSMLKQRPFVLSVPAETQRDFIYVDDAARRVNAWLSQPGDAGTATTKIIAAGRADTLIRVLAVSGQVTRVRPRLVMATNASSGLQPRYLRFRSEVLPELDQAHPSRGLEVGIKQLWQFMLRSQRG